MSDRRGSGTVEEESKEQETGEGVYVYNRELARGLNKGEWATFVASMLLQGKGKKKPRFFRYTILDENLRPIYEESTWQKIVRKIESGRYQPPQWSGGTKGLFFLDWLIKERLTVFFFLVFSRFGCIEGAASKVRRRSCSSFFQQRKESTCPSLETSRFWWLHSILKNQIQPASQNSLENPRRFRNPGQRIS